MEIKEELLDEMVNFIEANYEKRGTNLISVELGKYKDYVVRVEVIKPEGDQK